MLTCSSLVKHFTLRLFFIFVSVFINKCAGINDLPTLKEENSCPFIETLSFGSDIDIQCNDTYLIFETNKLNWKFADQSLFCQQKEKQHGFVNQCNITRIDSKYLKVPLRSLDHNEYACVYCPINYKPISPMIIVTQSDDGYHSMYRFNLTATGLAHNESFEILWAKRASYHIHQSLNYWFFQGCIDPVVEILEDSGHTIIFTVDDYFIQRVEFIIRRCSGTCRNYRICDGEEFFDEISLNTFETPDSIEKISCDYDCLNGIIRPITTTTINNIIKEDVLLSSIELSNKNRTIKFLILFPILGLLIVLICVIFGVFIICRIRGLRTETIYTKASHINLDENK